MSSFCVSFLIITLLGVVMTYRDLSYKCKLNPRSYGFCKIQARGFSYDRYRKLCRRNVLRCMGTDNFFFDQESCEEACLKPKTN
ncbi:uncharacterized protein LOC26534528 [Drosophila yakuba]|uniref:BPTI/Kunitz inhibitor domain-containing protein n=1 Tax=Drosophila yakuba TaxID=7245 RepID=A0A0R1DJ50_DROYA|nr:uncharacterized protein LOC26534528 [Drosophila yakuba]KRJ97226.1 uncharacterized protein Dyak_GE27347 [Drosophila yakuba]